jgi:hypothetical protein
VGREAARRGRIPALATPPSPPPVGPPGRRPPLRGGVGVVDVSSPVAPARYLPAGEVGRAADRRGRDGIGRAAWASPFQHRFDDGCELIDGERSAAHLAVEEEGRRRAHAELLPPGLHVLDTIEERLVAQAGLELFL